MFPKMLMMLESLLMLPWEKLLAKKMQEKTLLFGIRIKDEDNFKIKYCQLSFILFTTKTFDGPKTNQQSHRTNVRNVNKWQKWICSTNKGVSYLKTYRPAYSRHMLRCQPSAGSSRPYRPQKGPKNFVKYKHTLCLL